VTCAYLGCCAVPPAPLRVVPAADLAGLDLHGELDGAIPAEVIGPPSP
jgi:hypothetical protein